MKTATAFVGRDGDVGKGSTTSKDEGVEEAMMLGGSSMRSQEEIESGSCRRRGWARSTTKKTRAISEEMELSASGRRRKSGIEGI